MEKLKVWLLSEKMALLWCIYNLLGANLVMSYDWMESRIQPSA